LSYRDKINNRMFSPACNNWRPTIPHGLFCDS